MIFDIFSIFDPTTFNSTLISPLFIILNIIILLSIFLSFWSSKPRFISPILIILDTIEHQLNQTISINLKAISNIISPLLIIIVIINLTGLIPYTFSTSRHLLFTLSLGLPLWLSLIISRINHQPKIFIAHFLPDGAPDWLNPFLVLIETTRITVRPITLSFRLAANMRAGHIVLGLVGIYGASSIFISSTLTLILLSIILIYIIFELAICYIQGYIFCLLLSLYSNEHTHQ